MIDDTKLMSVYRLKNIIRYNSRVRLTNETVAEHSFYVALLSLILCNTLQVNDEIKLKVLIKALLHDMPEIETNDITHDVKERLNLRALLKQYEDDYYEKEFPEYVELMTKNERLVDNIVSLADTYSVKQYILRELELGNQSKEMDEILDDAKIRIAVKEKELKDESSIRI